MADEIKTWRALAREQFGDAVTITSNGRWALCALDARGVVVSVYLLDTETHAKAAALGVDRPKVVDLAPKFVPNIKDDWEDVQRERRARRSAA